MKSVRPWLIRWPAALALVLTAGPAGRCEPVNYSFASQAADVVAAGKPAWNPFTRGDTIYGTLRYDPAAPPQGMLVQAWHVVNGSPAGISPATSVMVDVRPLPVAGASAAAVTVTGGRGTPYDWLSYAWRKSVMVQATQSHQLPDVGPNGNPAGPAAAAQGPENKALAQAGRGTPGGAASSSAASGPGLTDPSDPTDPAGHTVLAAPEPASASLLAVGLLVFACRRGRRR